MTSHLQRSRAKSAARLSISTLLIVIFTSGFLVASIIIYSAFSTYRNEAINRMANADVDRISHLIFEHLYSVMRKGWTQPEIDDIVHHVQTQLPGYEVTIFRGEPVIRQFGDRKGQKQSRTEDAELQAVLASGNAHFGQIGQKLRYLHPIKSTAECVVCHTASKVGDINGVIGVSVSVEATAAPIVNIAVPVMYVTVALVLVLMLATFLIVRQRVSGPIADLASHVSDVSENKEYDKDLSINPQWPQEVLSLANNFNQLMENVRGSHAQLLESSMRDPLTGLFNRRHFDLSIIQAVADAQRGAAIFAVLYIDLDHFKPINDRLGHAAGDAMLIHVARTLQETVRDSDLAARVGGDEFAVLTLGLSADEVREQAERLRAHICAIELRFGHETVRAACSIGAAIYPNDGRYAEELLRAADAEMYRDKTTRKQLSAHNESKNA